MDIRFAYPSEFDELGDLTADVYINEGHLPYGAADPYVPELKAVARRAVEADVLVAVEDGRVLGGITYATSISPWADIAGADEAEIRMLVVDPNARGRGVGRALVQACIDRARDHRLRQLVLSSASTNTAAQSLYQSMGFVAVPTRNWRPSGSTTDLRAFAVTV